MQGQALQCGLVMQCSVLQCIAVHCNCRVYTDHAAPFSIPVQDEKSSLRFEIGLDTTQVILTAYIVGNDLKDWYGPLVLELSTGKAIGELKPWVVPAHSAYNLEGM